jgi:ubiquinone biosynthesis protein COQ4
MRILSVILNQAKVNQNEFIQTDNIQKLLLTAGSGLISILDPHRDDMISAFGELTGRNTLPKIHKMMLQDLEGRQLLLDKPIINSKTVDLQKLANYPKQTFGREYSDFLHANNITPDSRKPVHFIEDPELAYVMKRYREIHDFTHCILGMKTNMIGEVTVKIFEAIQLGLPMCWLGGLFGILRLGPKHTQQYLDVNLPWIINNASKSKPLINVYFEKHFMKPIDQLRNELNLTVLIKQK